MTKSENTIRMAEIALASSAALMEEYYMQRRNGWHHHWTPDGAVRLASRHPDVKALIWC